jgi:hypothetical protein
MATQVYEVPDVSLVSILDGVVSTSTWYTYIKAIFAYLLWCWLEESTAPTEWGLWHINEYVLESEINLTARRLFPRVCARFDDLLCSADMAPIVQLDEITSELYINYSRQLQNIKSCSHLGKSTIKVKQSALFHLFCLQNGEG